MRVQVAIDFMDAIKGGKREIRLGGFKGVPGGKTVEVDIPAGKLNILMTHTYPFMHQ